MKERKLLSAIQAKLQWIENDLSGLAAPEGITLDAVRDSIEKIQRNILRELFDRLSDGDSEAVLVIPSGFEHASKAFLDKCNQLGPGGLLLLAVSALDGCRRCIENEEFNHALIVDQLCVAIRMHERFQNLLLQAPALRETWAELLSETRRHQAARGARGLHAVDPRQQEKALIKEQWAEWQGNPTRYRGKAEFAKQMLKECKHLTSQKVIEDWCRIWEKT
ncbi:MAG: hypothetical protein WCY08_05955 [Rhodocyclaceae bacterium]